MAATRVFVFLCLAVGISAGEYCGYNDDLYCSEGCCGDSCCYEDVGMSSGAWAGIIIAAVIVKAVFWIACCYAIRRRRQTILVQRVMVPQTTVNVNPAHAGYNQHGRPMTAARPPMPPQYNNLGQAVAPPPYEVPSAIPPPK